MAACRWPGCPTPAHGQPGWWCQRHDAYWKPFRWGQSQRSPAKVAELRALPYEERVRRGTAGPREHRELPVGGLYRVLVDRWRVERMLQARDERVAKFLNEREP